jgi:hypothetical protein
MYVEAVSRRLSSMGATASRVAYACPGRLGRAGRWVRSRLVGGRGAAAVGVVACTAALLIAPFGAAATPDTTPDVTDVLVDEIGPGWGLVGDQQADLAMVVRTFANGQGEQVIINALPVTDPPGVRQLFQVFSSRVGGLTAIDEPSLELGSWLVADGDQPGVGPLTMLAFASRDGVFLASHLSGGGGPPTDVVTLLRGVADRQIAAAGGPPQPELTTRDTSGDDELIALLPDEGPPGTGLVAATTVVAADELDGAEGSQSEVAAFLSSKSSTAVRLYNADDMIVGLSLTKYPYEIFAAADLGVSRRDDDVTIIAEGAAAGAPDAALLVAADGQVSTVARQGEYAARVLVDPGPGMSQQDAATVAAEMMAITMAGLPPGSTSEYTFPGTPSKLGGLALSAGIVTAAAAGSLIVSRLRARRVRRRWERESPVELAFDPPETAIALDADARALRRQGAVLAGGQLLAVVIGIVALAGDFRWTGFAVAAGALVAGVGLTRWWQRRELGLLGQAAPPRELVLPRPMGAVLGILALAVLGFGVGFALKGLRYIVLGPNLANLRWSDLLGIAPRTVGYVFLIGGFVTAMLGASLFRIARSFARANTERVLEADPRPAALYLRSFGDDQLPLPVIASARRPFFELFSLRGADPFEEAVAWELNSYGPVVAVGRPGRSLASLGAAREHLADDTWREQVTDRMGEAGIIAVATGETDGLAWEVQRLVDGGHLHKTFFVFPPVAPSELERRWKHTSESLSRAGMSVDVLTVPVRAVHTVHVEGDGSLRVTFASRRDEATYRTAVDRTLVTTEPTVAMVTAPLQVERTPT